MASQKELNEEFQLFDEVKELLENYKYKKATVYEPCTLKNYMECLIGLREEFGLLNINYIFNPYLDIENNSVTPPALVNLINATWTLLHYHKNLLEQKDHLKQYKHSSDSTNKQLHAEIKGLKQELGVESKENRNYTNDIYKMTCRSEQLASVLNEVNAKLLMVTKQKESKEKYLNNEICRLQKENQILHDKLSNSSGTFVPCGASCASTINKMKEIEVKNRDIMIRLQHEKNELLNEVIALKEKVLYQDVSCLHIDKRK